MRVTSGTAAIGHLSKLASFASATRHDFLPKRLIESGFRGIKTSCGVVSMRISTRLQSYQRWCTSSA